MYCLLNAILYIVVAAVVAFARVLVAGLIDSPVDVPVLAQAHSLLCSVALVVLAAALLWLRAAIAYAPAGPRGARVARTTRGFSLVVAAVILVAGVLVVLATSVTLPTVVATIVTVVFVAYTYLGAAKAGSLISGSQAVDGGNRDEGSLGGSPGPVLALGHISGFRRCFMTDAVDRGGR